MNRQAKGLSKHHCILSSQLLCPFKDMETATFSGKGSRFPRSTANLQGYYRNLSRSPFGAPAPPTSARYYLDVDSREVPLDLMASETPQWCHVLCLCSVGCTTFSTLPSTGGLAVAKEGLANGRNGETHPSHWSLIASLPPLRMEGGTNYLVLQVGPA